MGLWCVDGLGISLVQVVTTLDHNTSYCIMQNCRVAEILIYWLTVRPVFKI